MVKKKRQTTLGGRKSSSLPKVNPFELKFNRLKHDVGSGHPGLSRKRAYEQRQKSLGVEYDRRGKVNKIVDKRIGERRKGVSSEEKLKVYRFSAERLRHLKKSSKFNLTDDSEQSEVLTHGGEALTSIQKYDKIVASDDEDDAGNIEADVVKVAHFGGGELDMPSNSGCRPSRKDIIADLIAKTRQARENKHSAKDEMETVTEELDAKYLKNLENIKNSFRPVGATRVAKFDKDDYDELALSLKLDADARATPAERTKTAEELALYERLQLEKLESLRIARMRKLMNVDKVEKVSKRKILRDSDEDLSDEELQDGNEEELGDLIQEINSEVYLHCGSKSMLCLGVLDVEVPFIIEMPKTFEQFVDLLSSYPSEKFEVVLLRLIKCYHPSLAEGNKKLLAKLFLYVLRFFDGSSCESLTSDSLKLLGSLINVMYVLMKFDVEFSTRCIRALIRQYWKKRLSNLKAPISFSVVALLVAALYPVSDGWHPVCSPALTLAAMTLAKSHVINLTVLARQILLVTVISDFVEESKRLVPEAIAFCQGALLMAVENEERERAPTVVFPISLPHKQMLYVEKDANVDPLTISEESDMKRCQVLRALIAVIQKYRILYSAHEHTFTITFTPFLNLLKRIPLSRLPSTVAEEIETLIQSMEAECNVRSRLTQMSRVVTEKSHFIVIKFHAEKQKLQYLVKKETRGAIKELRKDASFLSRYSSKDRDRRQKTKRIIGELQSQQGEWNKELRESGKKRKT
uniref:Nucleolar protein 14 n=1 Tax=Angiostrongylus cantonensis TaxID=6313 RepID=A0A0K0DF96_ANGCA